jgi:hypothetical protein
MTNLAVAIIDHLLDMFSAKDQKAFDIHKEQVLNSVDMYKFDHIKTRYVDAYLRERGGAV